MTGGTVFIDHGRLHTVSLYPGIKVYGEHLSVFNEVEYREWPPQRSKLSAYLTNGGKYFPFKEDSKVLYLGASSGTTPSHVSDIVRKGSIYCIEFAPRMFRDLVQTCDHRPNMIPILGDATKPENYQFIVENADIIYEDVAQKRQADIIADNMDMFNAKYGMVAIKARSEDVTMEPNEVFKASERRLKDRGFEILETRSLEPFENAHAMIIFKRP
ncbi:MAG: fibrillarin-like rRNA/tRNA 2'-O-methyltransferase [Candidatus Methanomethylophilaceae archaeon]|nr:fibrillarin-like rRNA/tRNA 2'-O-methyltransferase [Candidatus Methanomethylophilaceae archaeon]